MGCARWSNTRSFHRGTLSMTQCVSWSEGIPASAGKKGRNMYLSRIPLDTTRRETVRALYAPGMLHGAVESAFPGEKERRLWRIDQLRGQTYLLLLSAEKPDLSGMQAQFGFRDRGWETKDYQPLLDRIREGSRWRFRIVCNPTRSAPCGPGVRGRVEAITVAPQQRDWLVRQGQQHGFTVHEGEFDVIGSEWKRFRKGKENGREVILLQTMFEGFLTVTDAPAFVETLTNGLGRGKAYGMGMMTVMRDE